MGFFLKGINTKFYGNQSSRTRDDTCGQKSRRTDGQTWRS